LKSFEPADYKHLPNLFDHSDKISFARYDFECHFANGETCRYAFSMENSTHKAKDNAEMALRLPRDQALSKWVFDSIIVDKHVYGKKLRRGLYSVGGDVYHALKNIWENG
jgi:hypothetical protein